MAKQYIPTDELTFAGYKQSLKTFLQNQSQFSDYDFEGSNLAVLIDLLSYNAYNQAHYLNMVGSEMFLDTAQLRESIVSHAKELNYTPRGRISARANVVVEVVPGDFPATLTIPKFYQFKTTTTSAIAMSFVTDQPIVIKKDANNRYISDEFTIYEGVVVREVFTVEPTTITNTGVTTYDQRFTLQSENIDITSIEVSVKVDENDDSPVVRMRAQDLYGLDGNSPVFFVRGYKDNLYEIEFGDGILGGAVEAGNVIEVTYRDTLGVEGNGNLTFAKSTAIEGSTSITVTTRSRAGGGAERESDDSIKYNAVRHFQVQSRAVIASDYTSLIKTNFPEIEAVSVYGGEEVYQYGKVIVVLKPFNIEGVVDDNTKARIIEFLKSKTLVPEPIIVDPEYFYLGITGSAYYSLNSALVRESEISTQITNDLVALNNTAFSDFDIDVHQSIINKTITDANPSITGSDVNLTLVKRWAPQVGVATAFSFQIDNPIVSSNQGAYVNNQSYGVTTNLFKMILDDEIVDVVLRDDGIGGLFIHELQDSTTLVKRSPAIGAVDYTTGKITLTLDVYDYNQYIKFTCKTTNATINVVRNKFVLIDTPDLNIALVKV